MTKMSGIKNATTPTAKRMVIGIKPATTATVSPMRSFVRLFISYTLRAMALSGGLITANTPLFQAQGNLWTGRTLTDDPSRDICKGGLSSCKLRFGENEELGHGGYPAVSLIARS